MSQTVSFTEDIPVNMIDDMTRLYSYHRIADGTPATGFYYRREVKYEIVNGKKHGLGTIDCCLHHSGNEPTDGNGMDMTIQVYTIWENGKRHGTETIERSDDREMLYFTRIIQWENGSMVSNEILSGNRTDL